MSKFNCLVVLLLVLTACDPAKKGGSTDSSPAPEAPLTDLNVQTYDESGKRLRVLDESGSVVEEGYLLPNDYRVQKSRGFVAVVSEDQGRHLKIFNYQGRDLGTVELGDVSRVFLSDRILAYTAQRDGSWYLFAMDTQGKSLNTNSNSLDDDSNVYVSENIVAYTAEMRTTGKLLEQKPDGSQIFESVPAGRHLFSYNRFGQQLSTTSEALGDDTRVFVTKNLVAFTAHLLGEGERLSESGNSTTYATTDEGLRLFTYTSDDRNLGTAAEVLDQDTTFEVQDSFVVMNVPTFTTGKLIKDEGGVKTYESQRSGRSQKIFKFK